MNKKLLFLLLICNIIIISWCSKKEPEIINISTWTTNPASIYCEENWWILEFIKNNDWEFWICNFDDWSACEERDFFNWECFPLNESE